MADSLVGRAQTLLASETSAGSPGGPQMYPESDRH